MNDFSNIEIYNKATILIYDLLKNKNKVIIGIDGRCGSGKTTYSSFLEHKFLASVIHMDDFFLPKEIRVAHRLSEIGGNYHYERFIEEVSSNLRGSTDFEYSIFDCAIMDFNGKKQVKNSNLVVVEGAYSQNLKNDIDYDLKIFFEINEEIQLDRIKKRNPDKIEMFRSVWIPKEEEYIIKYEIKKNSDIIIDTSNII